MKPYIQKLLNMIPPENRSFMLDLGSGNGEDLEAFGKAGFITLGVDISEYVTSNVQMDIRSFNIEENKYSLIVCNNVFPFIADKNEIKNVITKIAKGLKDNGVMYFTVFGYKDEWVGRKGMSFFDDNELDEFLNELPVKFYERNIKVGYGKTKRGESKLWHILSYTYTKVPVN